MNLYRVLERFCRRDGEEQVMHEIHDLWTASPQEAAWNLSQKRIELVTLPYEHLGQKIITEVENVPLRKYRLSH